MKKIIYLLVGALAAIAFAPNASATAGYSRQTGMACNACHFQSYPALSEVGRAFKAAGYTMMGSQQKIEGSEGLSLPDTLNAGVVTKIRYQNSNGTTSGAGAATSKNDGQLQIFDELLLILGGRVSNNIGFQLELNLLGANTAPVVQNFKLPFIYDVGGVKAGIIPFTTGGGTADGQGVAYGFELLNTGAVRGARIMEARSSFSAQQYIGTATKAEGFALVASNAMYFANFSKWSPRSVGDASGSPTANYFRLALTPKLAGWDTGVGVQYWGGSATTTASAYTKTEAYALDAQAQGSVADMPLGIYLTYANASASKAGEAQNLFNSAANDESAATIAGQLGVLPGKATLLLAYRNGDTGAATKNGDNALTIGGTYQVVQNVQLQLDYEMYSGSKYDPKPAGGDDLVTIMLFASF